MMFNNAMAAAYYPSNGQYNYYFPVQQTAATIEEQPDLKWKRTKNEYKMPKNPYNF
jgi:hypothetical protein